MRINLRNLVTVPSYGPCPFSCVDVSRDEAVAFESLGSPEEKSLRVCAFLLWDGARCRGAVDAQVNIGLLSRDSAKRVLAEVERRCRAMADEDAEALAELSVGVGCSGGGAKKVGRPRKERASK